MDTCFGAVSSLHWPWIRLCQNLFSLETRLLLWKTLGTFSGDIYSSSPCQSHEGIFFNFSLWEFGGVPRGKTHEYVPPSPILQLPEVSLKLAHTQRPAIHQIYHLSSPTSLWLQWILLQISRSQLQLCGFACLSRFGGGKLPCNLSSDGSKKSHWFSVFSFFSL